MTKINGEKVQLWNCLKENKKVTLEKCTDCEYCTCFSDLKDGVYRTCIFDRFLIKDMSLIDGFDEEVMF